VQILTSRSQHTVKAIKNQNVKYGRANVGGPFSLFTQNGKPFTEQDLLGIHLGLAANYKVSLLIPGRVFLQANGPWFILVSPTVRTYVLMNSTR